VGFFDILNLTVGFFDILNLTVGFFDILNLTVGFFCRRKNSEINIIDHYMYFLQIVTVTQY
jgi:hypothetical protein